MHHDEGNKIRRRLHNESLEPCIGATTEGEGLASEGLVHQLPLDNKPGLRANLSCLENAQAFILMQRAWQ